jgi:hypothetical protein
LPVKLTIIRTDFFDKHQIRLCSDYKEHGSDEHSQDSDIGDDGLAASLRVVKTNQVTCRSKNNRLIEFAHRFVKENTVRTSSERRMRALEDHFQHMSAQSQFPSRLKLLNSKQDAKKVLRAGDHLREQCQVKN